MLKLNMSKNLNNRRKIANKWSFNKFYSILNGQNRVFDLELWFIQIDYKKLENSLVEIVTGMAFILISFISFFQALTLTLLITIFSIKMNELQSFQNLAINRCTI